MATWNTSLGSRCGALTATYPLLLAGLLLGGCGGEDSGRYASLSTVAASLTSAAVVGDRRWSGSTGATSPRSPIPTAPA
jgi:hypothetical protein